MTDDFKVRDNYFDPSIKLLSEALIDANTGRFVSNNVTFEFNLTSGRYHVEDVSREVFGLI